MLPLLSAIADITQPIATTIAGLLGKMLLPILSRTFPKNFNREIVDGVPQVCPHVFKVNFTVQTFGSVESRCTPPHLSSSMAGTEGSVALLFDMNWSLIFSQPRTRQWSVLMSAPRHTFTLIRELQKFLLMQTWSIWFNVSPLRDRHVPLWISLCWKRCPPMMSWFAAQGPEKRFSQPCSSVVILTFKSPNSSLTSCRVNPSKLSASTL